MKASLHPIIHDYEGKLWCGIAALASLSGRPTSEIKALIKQHIVRQRVMCMTDAEIRLIGRHLGLNIVFHAQFTPENRPTLMSFMRGRRDPEHTYLVGTKDHWFLADRNLCQDNHQVSPTAYNRFWCRRKHIEELHLCFS